MVEVVVKRPEVDIIEKIKIARKKNNKVVRVVKEMKKANARILRNKE